MPGTFRCHPHRWDIAGDTAHTGQDHPSKATSKGQLGLSTLAHTRLLGNLQVGAEASHVGSWVEKRGEGEKELAGLEGLLCAAVSLFPDSLGPKSC